MENRVEVGSRVSAVWCVDSETGQRYLIEEKSGRILMTEEQYNGYQGH